MAASLAPDFNPDRLYRLLIGQQQELDAMLRHPGAPQPGTDLRQRLDQHTEEAAALASTIYGPTADEEPAPTIDSPVEPEDLARLFASTLAASGRKADKLEDLLDVWSGPELSA